MAAKQPQRLIRACLEVLDGGSTELKLAQLLVENGYGVTDDKLAQIFDQLEIPTDMRDKILGFMDEWIATQTCTTDPYKMLARSSRSKRRKPGPVLFGSEAAPKTD